MKLRHLGKGMSGCSVMALALLTGCSGAPAPQEEETVGTLNLPLSTIGASGTQYRLRDAQFQIVPDYWSCSSGGGGAYPTTGGSGGSNCPPSVTVSSEDDPDATSIQVTLERGYYTIQLLPGWHMEKVEAGVPSQVEAQLLSPDTQWTYVQERTSTWVEYQFGIGGRELWFNGDLNINIRVYEDPSELGYGGTGMGGFPGGGGFPSTGGTSAGGFPTEGFAGSSSGGSSG